MASPSEAPRHRPNELQSIISLSTYAVGLNSITGSSKLLRIPLKHTEDLRRETMRGRRGVGKERDGEGGSYKMKNRVQ
ncbi:hypothetical protein KC19_VG141500 [Ceratodon purpureus]|uniref:Uncharacterized protein n=1 Tax=Ceratodon purpureus TaxID=3225 RepID=A0A8T0HQF8_CERPU|nr:hypothetical protein KC19_VG141500 [Ceratodon purpureus]